MIQITATRKLYKISKNLKSDGFLFREYFVRKKRSDLPVDDEEEKKDIASYTDSAAALW